MKMHENCLACVVSQTVRTARLTGADKREELYREVFAYLSRLDFGLTAPEVCGDIFAMVKKHIGEEDPYREIRARCNALMMGLLPELRQRLAAAEDPFALAVKFAILGNIIDFSAPGELSDEGILDAFSGAAGRVFARDEVSRLRDDCRKASSLLYLGDNCGEIAADVLLLEEIRRLNPDVKLTYAVRGAAVVNDVIESDALDCGVDRLAGIISNGDGSQGTALNRVSAAFRKVYDAADVIIAKGQANFESLSEEPRPGVYCLLMAKCAHIAEAVRVKPGSLAAFRL